MMDDREVIAPREAKQRGHGYRTAPRKKIRRLHGRVPAEWSTGFYT